MPSTTTSKLSPAPAKRKIERQRDILAAAVRTFSQHGYHDCTVSRVAQEAGVADGTIYLYFLNKEDLLVSAFRHVLEGMLAEMDRKVPEAPDAIAKLSSVTELHLQFAENDPVLARFLQFQLRQPDASIQKAIAAPLADYARRIESIIEEGKAAGIFRLDAETRVLRQVYFGAVDETVSAWLLRSADTSLQARTAPLLDVLLNGMRQR